MKKWKIGDIAELTIGGNQARAKDGLDGNIYYNHEDFKFDLERISLESYTMESSKNNDYFVKEGDVVINISSHLATIVGYRDENKKLTINFIKANLNKKIDKAYFLYLYNF